mgnify:CR=1 FL=1
MRTFFQSALGAAALSLSLLSPSVASADDHVLAQYAHTVDYIAAHGVSVVRSSDGGALVVLETDFNTRDRAELRLLLGRDGRPTPDADLGRLNRVKGLQVFKAPAHVNVQDFTEVHIWHPQKDIVIGSAPLN